MGIHVIDDEVALAELVFEALEIEGYAPLQMFHSGISYLMHMQSADYQAPKVLITDLMMPGIDGLQLIKEIRSKHPEIKIIVMSGRPDHLEQAEEADAALHKPFDFCLLYEQVEQLYHTGRGRCAGAA